MRQTALPGPSLNPQRLFRIGWGSPFVRQGDVPPTPTARALAPTSLPLIHHLGLSGAEDLLRDPAGRELSDFHPPRIVGSRLKAPLLARPLLQTANQGVWILVGSLLMSHTRTFLTRPTADPDRQFIQGCIKKWWFLSQGQAHPHCPVPRAMASSLSKHMFSAHSSVTVTECTHCCRGQSTGPNS